MVDIVTPVPAGTDLGVVLNGYLYGFNLLGDTTGADAMGLVTATPGAQTLLGRLKAIADALALPLDTVVKATPNDRGAIIGFTGAQITTTSASTTITLTTAPTLGALVLGQQIVAVGVPAGATLATLASGTLNAAGSTYTLSAAAMASGTAIATTSVGPQPIMAANATRRGIVMQVQSSNATVYFNPVATATADFHSLQIAPGGYYESSPQHISTGALSVISTVAATPLYAREF
jgi:hypothetical protein